MARVHWKEVRPFLPTCFQVVRLSPTVLSPAQKLLVFPGVKTHFTKSFTFILVSKNLLKETAHYTQAISIFNRGLFNLISIYNL